MFLEHVNMSVLDLERTIDFYHRILDLDVRWRGTTTDGTPAAHVGDDRCYDRERVAYASQAVQLSGILWTPQTPGPHPALVLVDGSGQTTAERLEPWARRFTEWGLACLSYDKRGVGE